MSLILYFADLKRRLDAAWSCLQQHVIDEAMWRGRLCICVRTDGRQFEHLLWWSEQFFGVLLLTLLDSYLTSLTFVWRLHIIVDAVLYTVKIVTNFYTVQYEHTKTSCGGLCICVCFKFPQVCFCRKLAKSVDVRQRYHKGWRSLYGTRCTACGSMA